MCKVVKNLKLELLRLSNKICNSAYVFSPTRVLPKLALDRRMSRVLSQLSGFRPIAENIQNCAMMKLLYLQKWSVVTVTWTKLAQSYDLEESNDFDKDSSLAKIQTQLCWKVTAELVIEFRRKILFALVPTESQQLLWCQLRFGQNDLVNQKYCNENKNYLLVIT